MTDPTRRSNSPSAGVRAVLADEAALGLRAGTVRVVEHDPAWAELYQGLARDLAAALGPGAEIAHVGSTSVPGLAAKPVLDIAIGLDEPIDQAATTAALGALGFEFVSDLGLYGGLFYTVTRPPDLAVVHVHVVDRRDVQWRWYLAFRDGLRRDPELQRAYQRLKQAAASQYASDRDGYNRAKFDWVLETVHDLDRGGRAT